MRLYFIGSGRKYFENNELNLIGQKYAKEIGKILHLVINRIINGKLLSRNRNRNIIIINVHFIKIN